MAAGTVFPKVDTPYGQAPMGLEGSGAFGTVGIGTETWAVLSRIPEGAYGIHRASGPRCQGLCRKVASLRSGGRRLAVRTAMENHIGAMPRTPFPASRDFPSRGNEKIGGTGYCVTYDTDSQSRNVLASPLGEEGHEVAKGCTRVRMIMIFYADVTAEGGL